MAGTLYVVATPIGNLEDITVRAIKILLTTEVIACEDTRRTGQLVKILSERFPQYLGEGHKKFISVRDWNEGKMVSLLLGYLVHSDVALVSDAGTPLISDPGFKVVRAAREAGFNVSPIPGPSAVTAALSVSGLPTNKFIFLGFLGKRWELLPGYTHVIYENPMRVSKTIDKILLKYPEAEMVLASELTKVHENITKGGDTGKGEVAVLVYLPDF